jgi:MoaA/NifB/PqqE/SkfB family radical SAM enzyme
MKKQTVAFSKKSANLFFHILTRCNLSCTHCYINPEQHGTQTLPIDVIREWLTLFSKDAPKTNLILLGGEPTLHPDLPEAVKVAVRIGFKSVTIDTNGYLFHGVLDHISPDDVDFISFSLDGATPETNDAIRGKGCFDTVMRGIKAARNKGFACSMIYTVSQRNIHELPLMPDIVKKTGVRHFFIQVIGLRGKSSRADDGLQVPESLWRKIIPEAAQEIAGQGVTVTYPKVFLGPDEPFSCAGKVADNYFVFPNGRVYQCPVCEDFPLHSWEIKENRLTERPKINETDLFRLTIPEGCVMNRMIQPENLDYDEQGHPLYRIACCLLKEEISPAE